MSKSWSGEAELQTALRELCGSYPVAASKIRQAVTVANKYSQEFKMVVYEIERFIKKAAMEDKIAGVFVIDSLCRQHSKERETFAKRFALRLKETFGFLAKIPSRDKAKLLFLYLPIYALKISEPYGYTGGNSKICGRVAQEGDIRAFPDAGDSADCRNPEHFFRVCCGAV